MIAMLLFKWWSRVYIYHSFCVTKNNIFLKSKIMLHYATALITLTPSQFIEMPVRSQKNNNNCTFKTIQMSNMSLGYKFHKQWSLRCTLVSPDELSSFQFPLFQQIWNSVIEYRNNNVKISSLSIKYSTQKQTSDR
jgi:hypothetical protein